MLKLDMNNLFSNIKPRVLALFKRRGKKQLNKTIKLFLVILIVYFIGGVFLSYIIFIKKSQLKNVNDMLAVYPLPAEYVSGEVVGVKEINKQVGYALKYSMQSGQNIDPQEVLRKNAIDQQAENILVIKELTKNKIYVSSQEIEATFNNISEKNGGKQEITKVLQSLWGMSVSDFKRLIKVQIAKDKIQDKVIKRAKVKHILLAEEKQATELIKSLQDGSRQFDQVAKEFSKDVDHKDNGGDLGRISYGKYPENFEKAVFDDSEVGKIYGTPIKTEFGYHIILVEERTGTIAKSYEKWLEDTKKSSRIIIFLR